MLNSIKKAKNTLKPTIDIYTIIWQINLQIKNVNMKTKIR